MEWEEDIVGSARSELLESRAMTMEASLAQNSAGKADNICIDGSLVSRLMKSRPESANEIVKKCGACVFISKTSESRSQFGQMGSKAGDIYYYGHICKRQASVFLLKHDSATHPCLKSMQGCVTILLLSELKS
jgi:hypothetical protein